jgi:hypothetical protein
MEEGKVEELNGLCHQMERKRKGKDFVSGFLEKCYPVLI